jgi:tetratricopeptide (TPR) repeat protein
MHKSGIGLSLKQITDQLCKNPQNQSACNNRYSAAFVYVVLLLVTFTVYWPVRNHDFVIFDDEIYVSQNPHVQAGLTATDVRWVFTHRYASFWHPLTMLSHMLDCELFGLNPAGHHLTNLVLHAANTLLLFLVLKSMTGAFWQSVFVAAAFALHPLHVESVAWVSERKDVLSTLLWLLTMAAYVRYVRNSDAKWYVVTLLLFASGLMAKPMLVTLPFILLLLDYWPLNRLTRYTIFEKLPFFILSAISSVIAFLAQKSEDSLSLTLPLGIRIANALVSYLSYIEKMIWPAGLAVFYPHPGKNLAIKQAVVAFALLLSITIWIVSLARLRRYLLVGWLWYLGTLVPVIGLVQVGSFAMADRYSYIPLTGLFIIIAWGVSELVSKWRYQKIVIGISMLAVLSAMAVCTRLQLRYWRDSTVLCERAIAATGDNFVAYYGLGITLCKQNKLDEGMRYLAESLRIRPNNYIPHYNIGLALTRQGRLDEAVSHYQQALQIKPDAHEVHNNLGVILIMRGRFDEAVAHFRQALQVKPDYDDAHYNLGRALALHGKTSEAIDHYRQALKINPNHIGAREALGSLSENTK